MKPHPDGDPTMAANIVIGVSTLCAKIYSSSKNKFKERYFYKKGGHKCVEALYQQIPPGMRSNTWNQLLEFIRMKKTFIEQRLILLTRLSKNTQVTMVARRMLKSDMNGSKCWR